MSVKQTRLLTLDDAPALQALYEACADFSLQMSGEGVPPDAALRDLQEPAAATIDATSCFVGWWRDADLQAMMEYRLHYPKPGVCFIGVLQVAPAQRNQGLGAQMLNALKQQWRSEGVHELRLTVLDISAAAQRFWQRQGFAWHATLPEARFGQKVHVRHELRMPLR